MIDNRRVSYINIILSSAAKKNISLSTGFDSYFHYLEEGLLGSARQRKHEILEAFDNSSQEYIQVIQ